MRTETTLRKALVEGECEFWDFLCPGFAPNPFLVLGWGGFGISAFGFFVLFVVLDGGAAPLPGASACT